MKRLICDRNGATAIEYGLIAAGVAAIIVVLLAMVGPALLGVFQNIINSF
jgi:pilus assembly protein Flp/PilA